MRLNNVSELIHNSTNHQNLDSAGVSVHYQEIIDLSFCNVYSPTYLLMISTSPILKSPLFLTPRTTLFKVIHRYSMRGMCTTSSIPAEKAGLKLLVTAAPRAQMMVGIWLFGSTAWVFSMVILGGITRFTRSGLSMTDWKFTGNLLLWRRKTEHMNLRNTSNPPSTSGDEAKGESLPACSSTYFSFCYILWSSLDRSFSSNA